MKLVIRNADGTQTPLADVVKGLKQLMEEISDDMTALQRSEGHIQPHKEMNVE